MPPPFLAPCLDNSLHNTEAILQAVFVGPVVFHSSQPGGPSPFASHGFLLLKCKNIDKYETGSTKI